MLVFIKIMTWIASPSGLFICGAAFAAIFYFFRRRRFATALASLSILQLIVFAMPMTEEVLVEALEKKARQLESQNQKAAYMLTGQKYGAIVLLGGGVSPAIPPHRPHPDLGGSADRVWHAARLYKEGLASKVILSGGRGPGLEGRTDIQTEAQAMRLFLLDLGVPDSAILLEDRSRTTRENATMTRAIIGTAPVALVTSATHMPRAFNNFREAGLNAYAYPTDFNVASDAVPLWARLLPTGSTLGSSDAAIKEYIALLINY